jgi:hypothetical protein
MARTVLKYADLFFDSVSLKDVEKYFNGIVRIKNVNFS